MAHRGVLLAVLLALSPGSLVNAERVSYELAPLSESSSLSSYAQAHVERMATAGEIFHSDDPASAAESGWLSVGEIVGAGGSIASVHDAFMDSPGHRAQILGDYTDYGAGVAIAGDTVYVVVVFVKYGSAPASTPITPTTTARASTTTIAIPLPILLVPDHIRACDVQWVQAICLD